MKAKRTYDRASRTRAAEETRQRVLDAARTLFSRSGIDGVTLAQIAEHSEVAASTIYALFASKAGILRALLHRAVFNADYDRIARELKDVADPVAQLRLTASVARSIYDGETKEMALLRGASAFSPDLKKLERELEAKRYELQQDRLAALFERGLQRPGLRLEHARDVMWMLTSRDVYRMLVLERKWSADEYEKWLAQALVRDLAGG